jgi:hypothetical protein
MKDINVQYPDNMECQVSKKTGAMVICRGRVCRVFFCRGHVCRAYCYVSYLSLALFVARNP